jgi:hypothetical protein
MNEKINATLLHRFVVGRWEIRVVQADENEPTSGWPYPVLVGDENGCLFMCDNPQEVFDAAAIFAACQSLIMALMCEESYEEWRKRHCPTDFRG